MSFQPNKKRKPTPLDSDSTTGRTTTALHSSTRTAASAAAATATSTKTASNKVLTTNHKNKNNQSSRRRQQQLLQDEDDDQEEEKFDDNDDHPENNYNNNNDLMTLELSRELEIAEYATVGHGHYKRKTPRRIRKDRTRKRKLLEKQDQDEYYNSHHLQEQEQHHAHAIQNSNDTKDGNDNGNGNATTSKQGCLVHETFQLSNQMETTENDNDIEENDEEEEEIDEDIELVMDNDELEEDEDDEEDIVEDNDEDDFDEAFEEEDIVDEDDEDYDDDEINAPEESQEQLKSKLISKQPKMTKRTRMKAVKRQASSMSLSLSSSGQPPQQQPQYRKKSIRRKVFHKKTRPYRMRNNFKSQRMAERHGEALGAHSRGLHSLAISKLAQVAMDAPTAPQVYTSLGMIYEDMLKQESNWKERVMLAKKAYGSYHIAAVLCKKDYMVWVRAADTARGVADLYSEAMLEQQQQQQPSIIANENDASLTETNRALKRYWIQEAQKDYQTADNLKPPGLDVPSKLAAAYMELGNLSEALKIMTDLKDRPGHTHKTWMLYSELMLRIGFECQQWNAGDESNMDYALRRWLRKYSRLFNWQERRLQALSLALEAAAGTACCYNLMQWTVERAKEKREQSLGKSDDVLAGDIRWCMDCYETQPIDEVESEENLAEEAELPVHSKDDSQDDEISRIERSKFDAIRSALLLETTNQAFDRETLNVDIREHDPQNGERVNNMNPNLREIEETTDGHNAVSITSESRPTTLPIAASCATVCTIASELLKHGLGLEQYKCGRLVAESVSQYFMARAATRDKHVEFNKAFQAKQSSSSSEILLHQEAYDLIEDDLDSPEDEFVDYLSDEEAMDSDPHLLEHLSRGVLPPELQVLLALCLIGEGGRDFVAAKCLGAINVLCDDTLKPIDHTIVDVDVICHPAWQVFQHAMTDQLTTTSALAFVADMLKTVQKEREWAPQVAPIFQNAMCLIQNAKLLDEALETEKTKSPSTALRRTRILKIVLAGARYRLVQCEKELSAIKDPSGAILSCLVDVETVVRRLWHMDESGSPSKCGIEALQVFAKSLSLLARAGSDIRNDVLSKLGSFTSQMVGNCTDCTVCQDALDEPDWSSFPLSSSWQDDGARAVSLRVHNLCVANSVALFSGWEKCEFTLDLMRRKRKNNYFGITLNNGRIVGFLDANSARQLEDAWRASKDVVATTIDIMDSLDKASSFLQNDIHVALPPDDGADVAIYGERDALAVFIAYAKQCFVVATACDSPERNKLIKIGMSVLLPITQFSILDSVWDSYLGRATGSLSGLDDWRTLAVSKPTPRVSRPVGPRPLRKDQRRSIKQWHQTDLSLIARIVVIPNKFILAEWNRDSDDPSPKSNLQEYQLKLHDAVSLLRTCTADLTMQKASLQVTLILLDMMPHVANPFVVMQQAILFASQCSKGGNMDFHFKTTLPSAQDCSPKQALIILARAECLQALHFSQEATFLCSFVVRCCQLRRDGWNGSVEGGWTYQWKIVGIHAYNLAMATRSTICATQYDRDSQKKALEVWDDEVLGELERCRCDAIALRKETVDDHFVDKVVLGDEGADEGTNEQDGTVDDDVNSVSENHESLTKRSHRVEENHADLSEL